MHQRQATVDAIAVSGLCRSQPDGGKGRLDRVGRPEMLPVRGRKVVERQQPLAVCGQVIGGLGENK